jgi:hypothetical protein
LRALAPGHQFLHLVAATALAAISRTVASLLGLLRIIGFESLAISLDLLVQRGDLFGQLPLREDAPLAGIAVEQGAVDRNNAPADQVEFAK